MFSNLPYMNLKKFKLSALVFFLFPLLIEIDVAFKNLPILGTGKSLLGRAQGSRLAVK
jgi:uncharacterized membrane protein YwaF